MADLEEDSDPSAAGDADNDKAIRFTKLFTPEEEWLYCKARVWNRGKGGQCGKRRTAPPGFCDTHKQQDMYQQLKYGRVDEVLTEKQLALFFGALQKADPKTVGKEAQEALEEYKALKEHKQRHNKALLVQKKFETKSLDELIVKAREVRAREEDIAFAKEDDLPQQKMVELIASKQEEQKAKEKRRRMSELKYFESKSRRQLLVKACEVGVTEEDIARTKEDKTEKRQTDKQILVDLILSKKAEQRRADTKKKRRGKGKSNSKEEGHESGSQFEDSISDSVSDSDSSSEITMPVPPKLSPRVSEVYISTAGEIITDLKELALTEDGAETQVVSGFDMWKAQKTNQLRTLEPRSVRDILQSRASGKRDADKDKKRPLVEDVGLASAEHLGKKLKVQAAASSAKDVARGFLAASLANTVAPEKVSRATTAAVGAASPAVSEDSEYAGMFDDAWAIQLQPSG